MNVEVRFALPHEEIPVCNFAKQFKAVSEFAGLWRRWGNWENNPPIVAKAEDLLAGFHAATFNRNGYTNSYYQAVDSRFRGQGVGGKMVDFLLQQAAEYEAKRLKFRTPKGGLGQIFWCGFGLQPFGEEGGDYLFDLSLEGVGSAQDLIARAGELCRVPIPDFALKQYRRKGVKFLQSDWRKT